MSGILRAELRKITTTKLWWILLIGVVLLAGGYAAYVAVVAVLPPTTGGAFNDPGIVRSVYNGGNPATRWLAMVLGIAAMGAEYRHQTLATTYLATPRRVRLLLGKAGSLLVFGLVYGVASVAAGVCVAVPFLLANDGSFFLDRFDTWRSLVLGVLAVALWALFGMGIGILIRNFLVAMVTGLAFAFLIEPVLAVVCYLRGLDGPLNALPTGATNAMLGLTSPVLFPSGAPLPWWQGALVLAAWLLVPAAVGILSTVRRDVT